MAMSNKILDYLNASLTKAELDARFQFGEKLGRVQTSSDGIYFYRKGAPPMQALPVAEFQALMASHAATFDPGAVTGITAFTTTNMSPVNKGAAYIPRDRLDALGDLLGVTE
jgi:hypothetical protein